MLADMTSELTGAAPGVDYAYAKTLINEAWGDVRREGGWSWQLKQTGFTVPGALANGTVTLTFGSPQVIGDALASAAWLQLGLGTQYGSLLTQRQFRSGGISGAGTMYDIVAMDQTTPTAVVLTLDRPFTDPLVTLTAPVTTQKYSIYQPYITAPVKDFARWLNVFDIANSGWLFVRGDRREVGLVDPQRQRFSNPDRLLALGQDDRVNSSTLGWERYELWPGPQNQFLYMAWFARNGADLVKNTDELPVGIPESMVKARARVRCYEQAEANKDPQNQRGAGADYRFLMGAAEKQYKAELKKARLSDRNKCDIFFSTMHRFRGGPAPTTYDPNSGGVLSQVGIR
jgi:hypothetical protein